MIALKNRWAYTVIRYWVTAKIFHFITTQGDRMQVPVTQVDRIYPALRPIHKEDVTSAIPGSQNR
jgi:hypothetical protein